jgi:NAD(P)-dependent dehydrogenase (short-subunit alcohol dehydrogenase family)
MTSLFDLSGEIAAVIGATGVLGGKMAEGLAGAGARVAVVGRDAGRGEACVQRIRDAGGEARFFSADAVSRESMRKAAAQIQDALGPVTVLVNTAGGNDPKVTVTADMKFEQIALEDWRANFDLNLMGGILVPCQEFGPAMVARGKGSIINIASVSAHIPLSRVVAYSAAKAAVLNLTQFLAREWAPRNVRVNTITPGFFPSEQNRRLLFNEDGTPSAREHLGAHADGPVWAGGGTHGGGNFSGQFPCQQLRHRSRLPRRWRLPLADDLRTLRFDPPSIC